MIINHVALICSSEENAEKFYGEILGLKKIKAFVIPASLTRQIFNLPNELKVMVYGNRKFKVELFSADEVVNPLPSHICLEVEERERLMEKCAERGVDIIKIPKGDTFHLFIKDYDGNLFEIKEKS